MEQDWATLGPKLRGKLHIWVGEADDYFLNNAVHLLDDFLTAAQPAFEGKITYGMRQKPLLALADDAADDGRDGGAGGEGAEGEEEASRLTSARRAAAQGAAAG